MRNMDLVKESFEAQFLPVIPYIIKKHFNQYVAQYWDDMFSVGCVALYEAKKNFDINKSNVAITYYARCIELKIRDFLCCERNKYAHRGSTGFLAGEVLRKYKNQLADVCSYDEILDTVLKEVHSHVSKKITKEELMRIDSMNNVKSIDNFMWFGEEFEFNVPSDDIDVEQECLDKIFYDTVVDIVKSSSEKKNYILLYLEWLYKTTQDIKINKKALGKKYGCSHTHVDNIIKRMNKYIAEKVVL